MESINQNIRWGWLKIIYIYTVISAGLLGGDLIAIPFGYVFRKDLINS